MQYQRHEGGGGGQQRAFPSYFNFTRMNTTSEHFIVHFAHWNMHWEVFRDYSYCSLSVMLNAIHVFPRTAHEPIRKFLAWLQKYHLFCQTHIFSLQKTCFHSTFCHSFKVILQGGTPQWWTFQWGFQCFVKISLMYTRLCEIQDRESCCTKSSFLTSTFSVLTDIW